MVNDKTVNLGTFEVVRVRYTAKLDGRLIDNPLKVGEVVCVIDARWPNTSFYVETHTLKIVKQNGKTFEVDYHPATFLHDFKRV